MQFKFLLLKHNLDTFCPGGSPGLGREVQGSHQRSDQSKRAITNEQAGTAGHLEMPEVPQAGHWRAVYAHRR